MIKGNPHATRSRSRVNSNMVANQSLGDQGFQAGTPGRKLNKSALGMKKVAKEPLKRTPAASYRREVQPDGTPKWVPIGQQESKVKVEGIDAINPSTEQSEHVDAKHVEDGEGEWGDEMGGTQQARLWAEFRDAKKLASRVPSNPSLRRSTPKGYKTPGPNTIVGRKSHLSAPAAKGFWTTPVVGSPTTQRRYHEAVDRDEAANSKRKKRRPGGKGRSPPPPEPKMSQLPAISPVHGKEQATWEGEDETFRADVEAWDNDSQLTDQQLRQQLDRSHQEVLYIQRLLKERRAAKPKRYSPQATSMDEGSEQTGASQCDELDEADEGDEDERDEDEGDEFEDEGEETEEVTDGDTPCSTTSEEVKTTIGTLNVTHEEVEEKVREVKYLEALNKERMLNRPDTARMADLSKGFVKSHGKVGTSETFVDNLMPFLKRTCQSEGMDPRLIDPKTPPWKKGSTDHDPGDLKARRELYTLIEGVVDTGIIGTAVLGTVEQQETADGQGMFKRLHDLLSFGMRHTDSLELEKKAATCTMMSTGLTAHGLYLKLMSYKVALANMGIHQSEEKTLIPRFKKGLSSAYVEVLRLLNGQMINKPRKYKTLEKVATFVRIEATKAGISGVTCSPKDKRFQGSASLETEKTEGKNRNSKGAKRREKAAKVKKELEEVKVQLAQVIKRGQTDCRDGAKCKQTNCGYKHPRTGGGSSTSTNPHPECPKCKRKHKVGWCGKCWTCGGDHMGRDCPKKKVKSQGAATLQGAAPEKTESNNSGGQTVLEETTNDGVRTITISQCYAGVTRGGCGETTKVLLVRKPGWFSELLEMYEQNRQEWEFKLPVGAQGALFNLVEGYTKEARRAHEGGSPLLQKPRQPARSSKHAKHDGPNRKRRRQILKNKQRCARKEKKQVATDSKPRRTQPKAPKRKVVVKRDRLYRLKMRLRTKRYGRPLLYNMKWWNMDEQNFKGADGFKARYKKRGEAARQSRVQYKEYQQFLRDYRSSCLAQQAKGYKEARANRVGKRAWMQRMSKVTAEMRHLFHAPSHPAQVNWRDKWDNCGWHTRSDQPSRSRIKVLERIDSWRGNPVDHADFKAWTGLTARVGEELLRVRKSSKAALWQAMAAEAEYYRKVVMRQLGDLFECAAAY